MTLTRTRKLNLEKLNNEYETPSDPIKNVLYELVKSFYKTGTIHRYTTANKLMDDINTGTITGFDSINKIVQKSIKSRRTEPTLQQSYERQQTRRTRQSLRTSLIIKNIDSELPTFESIFSTPPSDYNVAWTRGLKRLLPKLIEHLRIKNTNIVVDLN